MLFLLISYWLFWGSWGYQCNYRQMTSSINNILLIVNYALPWKEKPKNTMSLIRDQWRLFVSISGSLAGLTNKHAMKLTVLFYLCCWDDCTHLYKNKHSKLTIKHRKHTTLKIYISTYTFFCAALYVLALLQLTVTLGRATHFGLSTLQ